MERRGVLAWNKHCHSHPVNHSNGIWTGLAPLHEIQRTLTAVDIPCPAGRRKTHIIVSQPQCCPFIRGGGHGMLDDPVQSVQAKDTSTRRIFSPNSQSRCRADYTWVVSPLLCPLVSATTHGVCTLLTGTHA